MFAMFRLRGVQSTNRQTGTPPRSPHEVYVPQCRGSTNRSGTGIPPRSTDMSGMFWGALQLQSTRSAIGIPPRLPTCRRCSLMRGVQSTDRQLGCLQCHRHGRHVPKVPIQSTDWQLGYLEGYQHAGDVQDNKVIQPGYQRLKSALGGMRKCSRAPMPTTGLTGKPSPEAKRMP